MATRTPTVYNFPQRFFLSLSGPLQDMKALICDIPQAYMKSETPLERHVYISAPDEMQLPPDTILKVVRPLSGIAQSAYTGTSRIQTNM